MKYYTMAALAGAMIVSSGAAQAEQAYCREYTRTIHVGSRVQEGYGTACLQPDGAWEITGEREPDHIVVPVGATRYGQPYVVERERVYSGPQFVLSIGDPRPFYGHRKFRGDNGWHRGWRGERWHRDGGDWKRGHHHHHRKWRD